MKTSFGSHPPYTVGDNSIKLFTFSLGIKTATGLIYRDEHQFLSSILLWGLTKPGKKFAHPRNANICISNIPSKDQSQALASRYTYTYFPWYSTMS